MVEQSFDVFLAHSSQNKPLIRQLYRKLKERGIKPWLDEEEIAPGTSFQDEIQQAIAQIKTAAICIGQKGLGKWEALELKAFISQCVERGIPVIPVLLPGVIKVPENLVFLREFHAVAFARDLEDEQAYALLEWGITGQKPPSPMPLSAIPLTDEDSLSSEHFGINYYARLRDLLRCKDWKAADQETINRMCEVMNRKRGWLRVEDIDHFPCRDLLTIDQLWVKYSNGRFGFSVQTKIWQDCGSPTRCNHDLAKFGETVGWRTKGVLGLGGDWLFYLQLTFDESAPYGHLPWFLRYPHTWDLNFLGLGRSGGMTMSGDGGISHLALRLIACSA